MVWRDSWSDQECWLGPRMQSQGDEYIADLELLKHKPILDGSIYELIKLGSIAQTVNYITSPYWFS